MIGILFDIRSYMLTAWNLDNHGSICQILLKGLFAFISSYFAFLIICLYAQLQPFEKQRIIKDVQHLLVRIFCCSLMAFVKFGIYLLNQYFFYQPLPTSFASSKEVIFFGIFPISYFAPPIL